jgi:hypothetical protein
MKVSGTTSKIMTTHEICTLVDLMENYIDVNEESIQVSSNEVDKDKIISGGSPWSSSKDDISPTITVKLSKAEDIPLTHVTLDKTNNVESFELTVVDMSGSEVYQMVNMLFQ